MNNSNYNLVYNTLNKNNLARNEIGARTNNYVDNLVNIISTDNIVINSGLTFSENKITCEESRINNNLGSSRILGFSNATLQTTNSLLTYAQLQKDKSYVLSILNYYQDTEVQIYKKINDTQFELMKTLSNSYNFFYPGETIDVLLVIKNIVPLNKNPLTPYVGLFIAETPYAIDNYGQITGINNIPLDIWNEPSEIETIKDDNELVGLLNAEKVIIRTTPSTATITINPPQNEKLQNYFTTQGNKGNNLAQGKENDFIDLLILIPWRDNLATETRRTAHCLKKNNIATYKTYQARYTCLYGAKDYNQPAHIKMVLPIFQNMQMPISFDLNSTEALNKQNINYYPQFNKGKIITTENNYKRGHFHKNKINGQDFTGRRTLFTDNPYGVARLMNGGSKLLYYKGTDISAEPTYCNKTKNITITDKLTQKQYILKMLPYNCICFSGGILRITKDMLKANNNTKPQYGGFRRGNGKNANVFYPENFQGSISKNIIVPINLFGTNTYKIVDTKYQAIQTTAQDVEGYILK